MKLSAKHTLLAVAMGFVLSACHGKNPASSTVAAVMVNGKPISVAELEDKAGNMQGDKKAPVSAPMMKMAIDSELLRQAAVQDKMNEDAKVRASIDNSTRMILATAYLQKQLAAIGKPSESDVSDFYNKNPARYAQRKQYQFQEFSIQPPTGKAAEIQAQMAKIKSPDQLEKWLSDNKIPHSSTPTTSTGDQLSDEILQKVKDVPVGGNFVVGGNSQLNIVFVLSEQMQPMALAQAVPAITNQLWDKRKREMLDNRMKQLHEKAKVEYVAPYTDNGYTPADNQH